MLVADPLLGQRPLVLVARRAGALRIDPDDVEVERVRVARIARERLDPLELGQPPRRRAANVPQRGSRGAARACRAGRARSPRGRRRDSPCSRARRCRRASRAPRRMTPQVVDRRRDVVAVRRDDAALARGDVLRRVEREARGVGERADLAAAVLALDRVRGVLDDGQPERRAAGRGRPAGRRGAPAGSPSSAAPTSAAHVLGIDVEVARADVAEHRRRARCGR